MDYVKLVLLHFQTVIFVMINTYVLLVNLAFMSILVLANVKFVQMVVLYVPPQNAIHVHQVFTKQEIYVNLALTQMLAANYVITQVVFNAKIHISRVLHHVNSVKMLYKDA